VSVVIGVHDGHNASVAVVRDGRVELALQEERLTRVKNQGDAPAGAARAALALAGQANLAAVALNGRYMNYRQWERATILRDYEESSGPASRLKQPFKNTFLDRAYSCSRQGLLWRFGRVIRSPTGPTNASHSG
jgi:predicted NodU family carbamoyl transferase